MLKRILMNAADASPGNGAGPAPVASPTPASDQPQAQAATFTMTKADLDAAIASGAAAAIASAKDSIFAEARRTFAGGNKPPKTTETTTPSAPVQPDPIQLRSLDRALAKAGIADKLSDNQYKRAEKAFAEESPSDLDTWIKDLFPGLSASPAPVAHAAVPMNTTPAAIAAPTAPTAPVIPTPPAAPSAPNGASLPMQNGVVDLFSLTDEQRKALGPAGVKAALETLVQVGHQAAGMPTRPKPPAQR